MKPKFNSKEKKVLFFDLYDTLIDRNESMAQAMRESLEEFTARWENQGWNPALAVDKYRKELNKNPLYKPQTCLSKALQGSPFDLTDSFLRTLSKRMKERIPYNAALYSNVLPVLGQLNKKYSLGLISNGSRERIDIVLKSSGLSHLLPKQRMFVSSSRKFNKPHPAIFKKALKTLNIKPSEAVMVGNSWKKDIMGANRCGIDAIWIQPAHRKIRQRHIGQNKVIYLSGYKQLLALFRT